MVELTYFIYHPIIKRVLLNGWTLVFNNFPRPKVTLNDGSATSQNNTQQMNAITNTTIIATEKIQNLRNSNTLGKK